MRIIAETQHSGRFSLLAEVEDYDGVTPVNRLLIDYVPSALNPERVALAGYLAFGSWVSGGVDFPEAICPELASAIEDDAAPARVRPKEVNYTPKRLADGGYRAQILLRPTVLEPEELRSIRILPRGKYAGSLRKEGHFQVASNAYLLAGSLPEKVEHRPMLAVAVLSAEDLDISEFHLEGEIIEDEAERLRSLLGAAGLGLST